MKTREELKNLAQTALAKLVNSVEGETASVALLFWIQPDNILLLRSSEQNKPISDLHRLLLELVGSAVTRILTDSALRQKTEKEERDETKIQG